ncbi:hypothetical protein OG592_06440 [Streptomyces avidinii]|uniref:hypothetical protein n=1 Tax=Streptomyces avidinii TaxID=1895 RepID=UPI00386490D5|nr:hypothetical protein OG592_06440 [Streptomyces avidinii]
MHLAIRRALAVVAPAAVALSLLTPAAAQAETVPSRLNVVTGGHQSGVAVALAPTGRLSLTYSDDYDQNGFNEMRLRDGFLNK